MAGGPQDGQRFKRDFYTPHPTPPAMRASDGQVCCPVAVRTTRTEGGHHRIAEAEVERLPARHEPEQRARPQAK